MKGNRIEKILRVNSITEVLCNYLPFVLLYVMVRIIGSLNKGLIVGSAIMITAQFISNIVKNWNYKRFEKIKEMTADEQAVYFKFLKRKRENMEYHTTQKDLDLFIEFIDGTSNFILLRREFVVVLCAIGVCKVLEFSDAVGFLILVFTILVVTLNIVCTRSDEREIIE